MNFISQEILSYCEEKSTLPSELCQKLEVFTRENIPMSQMLIGKLEASFLIFLIRNYGIAHILEIGTFTGYSALAMAEALPANGTITSIDINPDTVAIAQQYWHMSSHAEKIKCLIGDASHLLQQLRQQEQKYDLIFIDADKASYPVYLELGLEMLSHSGIIIIDNSLWGGKVIKEKTHPHELDASTQGILAASNFAKNHPELFTCLLPVRDGLLMIGRNK